MYIHFYFLLIIFYATSLTFTKLHCISLCAKKKYETQYFLELHFLLDED